jgi:hypothetical protein
MRGCVRDDFVPNHTSGVFETLEPRRLPKSCPRPPLLRNSPLLTTESIGWHIDTPDLRGSVPYQDLDRSKAMGSRAMARKAAAKT